MTDHDRSDRVPLPAAEPRCEPMQPCTMRGRCARYSASIPQGTPLSDYSNVYMGGTALCSGFVDTASLRISAGQAGQGARRVHGPFGESA